MYSVHFIALHCTKLILTTEILYIKSLSIDSSFLDFLFCLFLLRTLQHGNTASKIFRNKCKRINSVKTKDCMLRSISTAKFLT